MSRHSPCAVENSEILARFVFSPIHIHHKTGNVKPSIFSHVFSVGCSIQRDSVATNKELISFANDFLGGDDKRSWRGVLLAECHELRSIKVENSLNRAVCVYDTAEQENPAHGEIGQTHHIINEADVVELRHALFTAFGNGAVIPPFQYRNGKVWDNLAQHFQARK